ncbi:MAG: GyrI-like domain-containing protein [Chloroflexi bacterium]|nr:GyrI-like domain-containing protein [Chloroflexota bacterium]MYB85574.1 GyrI-like domain-containing protein [Chloroflexota bacterium]
MAPSKITRLDPIAVMYLREYEKPSPEAFTELEAVVGRKGRRFYGVFDQDAGRYRACVRPHEHDDPVSLGLSTDTINGGLYAYERLRGDHEALIALIAPAFEALSERYNTDPARPSIEFYRRSDEFVLYLPITG